MRSSKMDPPEMRRNELGHRFRGYKQQRQIDTGHESGGPSLLLHNNHDEHLASGNNSHDRLTETDNKSIRPVELHQIEPTNNITSADSVAGRQELLLSVYATTDSAGRPPGLLLQAGGYTSGNFSSSNFDQHLKQDPIGDCLTKYGANLTSGTEAKGGLIACNENHMSLMDIRSEEYNFSDIERVWLVKSWQEILLRVAFVVPIVLLGTLGNATIIYSMCRFKPIRSKPTNIFILNMALADLITTIVCPNAALFTDIYQFYVLGSLVCRTEGFIKITCLLVSAYSLIVLSFDWFLSVVKPFRSRLGIRQAWTTLASIWLVSILMAVPLLFSRQLRERHWRDLTEIWCCELIQYTKYYWVCITLFLIYLPTFIMTVVLVVILLQMDRFEAKLRRSRNAPDSSSGTNTTSARRLSLSSAGVMRSSSFSIGLDTSHNQPSTNVSSIMKTSQQLTTGTFSSAGLSAGHNSSLSISMKYRRRIVKILLLYLLTSIVCWTPLQFTIVYRHFRSEAMPAKWFFELSFFAQLCASLSSAMNPIIFGFLSQPFRKIVVRSWLCRLMDKLWMNKRKRPPRDNHDNKGRNGPRGSGANGGGNRVEEHAMSNRVNAINLGSSRMANSNRNHLNKLSDLQATSTRGADLELQPKLTIDYIEHQPNTRHQANHSGRYGKQITRHQQDPSRPSTSNERPHREPLPGSATNAAPNHQVAAASAAGQNSRHQIVRRSLSSALNGIKSRGGANRSQEQKRALVAAETECGIENEAYSMGGNANT